MSRDPMSPEQMSIDHMSLENIGALMDGELTPAEEAQANAHLQGCHACALQALAAQQLKLATRQAALRFTPSPELLARLRAQAANGPAKSAQKSRWRPLAWSACAAALLIALFLTGSWQLRRSDTLTAELLDQHLAVLSDSSSPQVLSSDRHTVKPWFQGRLPFSFNLPEPSQLPADSALVGADLTYVNGRPTALLLFLIHKHRVSVFVSQSGPSQDLLLRNARSGFQIAHARAAGLEFVGVSDVNRPDLNALMAVLVNAQ
jgi:anti-sigma factor RsiW